MKQILIKIHKILNIQENILWIYEKLEKISNQQLNKFEKEIKQTKVCLLLL